MTAQLDAAANAEPFRQIIPCGAKKTAPFYFLNNSCQTRFYFDNFWHRYLNEFPTSMHVSHYQ